MTKSELKKYWEKTLEYLSSELDNVKINTYFKPLFPGKLDEKNLCLLLVTPMNTDTSLYYNMAVRYKDELENAIEKAILAKPACHTELSYEHRSNSNRNMNAIGG